MSTVKALEMENTLLRQSLIHALKTMEGMSANNDDGVWWFQEMARTRRDHIYTALKIAGMKDIINNANESTRTPIR